MDKPASVLYRSYRMCSDHFTAQDFMDPLRTRLKKSAVPTVDPCALSDRKFQHCLDSVDVSPVVAIVVTSRRNTVPENHLGEAMCISSMSEDPAVQGYSHPASEEQAGEDVLEETSEKGSLVTASHVAEGSLQAMSGCNSSVSELGPTDSQVDMSDSSSTRAEHSAVHDAVSKMSASTSSFIDTAANSGGDFSFGYNSAARSCPSKKFRTTIKRLQSKVASYRRTIARLRKQQDKLEPSISKALAIIRPHVTEEVFKLLCVHVQSQQKGTGKRFPAWVRKFALDLYFREPRAYEFMAPIFSLPTPRSLRRWMVSLE